MNIHIEKRLVTPQWQTVVTPIASVVLSLLLGALLLAFTGYNPKEVYTAMFLGVFGSSYALSETVLKSIPLMLTGLGVGIAMKMRLWNIGAEGQLLMGACAASGLALFGPDWPWYLMLPAMVLVSMLAGGLWAVVAAIPKALWDINEIITTLMLNYIAILWIRYLVQGPWRDPGLGAFPFTAKFPPAAWLPTLAGSRIHAGLLFALVAAAILSFVLIRSKWGFEIRVIGSSIPAARYAGMNVFRNILLTLFLSGSLAGLAGMAELSGVFHRLQDNLAAGAGYTAIIIASLAQGNPLFILLVSFLFGALLLGGTSAQTVGVSASIAAMLQGGILFFLLIGEFFLRYRLRRITPVIAETQFQEHENPGIEQ
jgi:general nucleoside transport system permease protein